jgi:hypothetical protein
MNENNMKNLKFLKENEEINFSEFIYEYYKEKYTNSKKMCEQNLYNIIESVEYYL